MPNRPDNGAPLLCGLALAHALVALVFAAHGRPNIDEGMFLWAGRLVAEGSLPYRDFPFAQAPMLAYAYAAAPVWFGSALLGGRLLAVAAGTLGAIGAFWLARRVAGDFAAIVTLLVGLATLPILWVGATARAQSIATPLLVLGVAALALRRDDIWRWSAAPSLLLWASSLRLTNLGVFAVVSLWVAWQLRRAPARLAGVAALVGAQTLVACLPVLRAPDAALFHIVTVQMTRGERFYLEPAPFLVRLSHILRAYPDLLPDAAALLLLALILTAIGVARAWRGWRPKLAAPLRDRDTAPILLAALGAVAFAPHLALSNAFLEYLIPLWALLAPAVGIGLAAELSRRGLGRGARWATALALLAFAAINFARHRDVWIGAGEASFASFRHVAGELEQLGGPDCTMLTFETELAVESGCRVFPGLEYSYFSYFAELPSEEARRRGVANLTLLRERVARIRPELIALAPGHGHLLLESNFGAPPGHSRPRIPGSVHPLEFLGPLSRHYELYGVMRMASGIRRAGARDVAPLRVYRRVRAR